MRRLQFLKITAPLLLAGGFIVVNCTGNAWPDLADPGGGDDVVGGADLSGGGGNDINNPEEVLPACDPDNVAPCPEDFFICFDTEEGKRCEGQHDAVPDDGNWDCYEEGTTIVCRGDHMPEAAADTPGYRTSPESKIGIAGTKAPGACA